MVARHVLHPADRGLGRRVAIDKECKIQSSTHQYPVQTSAAYNVKSESAAATHCIEASDL
jgi:hypothetical protein